MFCAAPLSGLSSLLQAVAMPLLQAGATHALAILVANHEEAEIRTQACIHARAHLCVYAHGRVGGGKRSKGKEFPSVRFNA